MSAGGRHRTTVTDRMWRQLRRRVRGIAKMRVKVGVVGDGAQADHGDGTTLAEIAVGHEYGNPSTGLPMRSFLRRTFVDKIDELKAMQHRMAKGLLSGALDVDKAFGLLGAWGAAAVRRTITSGAVTPKLEESAAGLRTIARKGSSKTLVDTGQLVNAITWAAIKGT